MTDHGVLYVVATPIGNLEDVSNRALKVLGSVAMIAAEDTRRSLSLLAALGITAPRTIALHEHNEERAAALVVGELQAGFDVALVSDAGTPLLSDPGFVLVRECFEQGLPVRPIPGASALSCVLSVCPLPTAGLQFAGFLPASDKARRTRLQSLCDANAPAVCFEAPHRMRRALQDLAELAPERRVFIGREMTKRFESYLCGSPAELIMMLDQAQAWRGEFVWILEGRVKSAAASQIDVDRVMRVLCAELAPAQAARLGAELLGMKKSALYALALQHKG